MLGRGVQVALLVLVGCRLLGGLRGKLGKKSRERRRLAQEAEMVMSELANADHYLKDNFEATPEAKHSVRSSDGAQLSPSLQGLSARSKNTEACRKLSELERLVERRGGFPPCAVVNGDLDRTLLRFLIASDYDVGRAADAVDDLKVWRRDERIDSLLGTAMRSLSAQKQNALRRCMPSTYHGRDLRGHPIHLEQTGRYNWEVLRHCEPEDLVRVHILAQEYQSRVLFPRASRDVGHTVDKMTNVLDLRGLNIGVLSNLQALSIFKEVQRIDQKYYPEMLNVTYIVNAGWVFRAVWRVLKVVFPAREQGKLKLVPRGKKGLEMLREAIPEEHIPAYLGGSCTYVKGCISGPGGTGDKACDGQEAMARDLREAGELLDRGAGADEVTAWALGQRKLAPE